MDRRRFLASAAATAIAPSCLAQPARVFVVTNQWCNVAGPDLTIASLDAMREHLRQQLFTFTAIPAHMQGPRA